jgi:hypothetical protein
MVVVRMWRLSVLLGECDVLVHVSKVGGLVTNCVTVSTRRAGSTPSSWR